MENYIWIVSEINVDELIPKINCFKYKNDGAYLFDDLTRIFGNKENDEIKIVLQLLRKQLSTEKSTSEE